MSNNIELLDKIIAAISFSVDKIVTDITVEKRTMHPDESRSMCGYAKLINDIEKTKEKIPPQEVTGDMKELLARAKEAIANLESNE